jgi:hypothetical protein
MHVNIDETGDDGVVVEIEMLKAGGRRPRASRDLDDAVALENERAWALDAIRKDEISARQDDHFLN